MNVPPVFNIDRWANYTRQNFSRGYGNNRVMSEYALHTCVGNWSEFTPKQARRIRKHARKGDTSIGVTSK